MKRRYYDCKNATKSCRSLTSSCQACPLWACKAECDNCGSVKEPGQDFINHHPVC